MKTGRCFTYMLSYEDVIQESISIFNFCQKSVCLSFFFFQDCCQLEICVTLRKNKIVWQKYVFNLWYFSIKTAKFLRLPALDSCSYQQKISTVAYSRKKPIFLLEAVTMLLQRLFLNTRFTGWSLVSISLLFQRRDKPFSIVTFQQCECRLRGLFTQRNCFFQLNVFLFEVTFATCCYSRNNLWQQSCQLLRRKRRHLVRKVQFMDLF